VDLTVGAGGHTEKLLEVVGAQGRVIGLDRDETALGIAGRRLKEAIEAGRLQLVKAPFSEVGRVLNELGLQGKVGGAMADIGVSSMHLDDAARGFSFQNDGPLDMRMDRSVGKTAADLVNELSEGELTAIFRDFGEEPKAKQVARRIVQDRAAKPFTRTAELAALVAAAARYPKPSKKHPATRVFQALRIAVNDELGELDRMLQDAFAALRPGGRLAVIAFHSLEDRRVKDAFIGLTGRKERAKLPRHLPIVDREVQQLAQATGEIVKPFPLVPSDQEIARNPRARSAKLRVVTKL
jgi:16S rRNA (cytosine1402-N4)-methyltransferase